MSLHFCLRTFCRRMHRHATQRIVAVLVVLLRPSMLVKASMTPSNFELIRVASTNR